MENYKKISKYLIFFLAILSIIGFSWAAYTIAPVTIADSILKNETYVYQGMRVNFSANWTNVSGGTFIFSIDKSGAFERNLSTGFVNSTFATFGVSGDTGNLTSNVTYFGWDIPLGTNVTWTFWVNNSEGNWTKSGYNSFKILDGRPMPQSVSKSHHTAYYGMIVNFSANWTAEYGRTSKSNQSFIFSINQGSGWVNYSAYRFTNNISSNTTLITAAPGTTVYWQFIANDTSGNWNATPVQSFVIPAPFLNWTDKNITDVFPNTWVNFSANWTNNISLDSFIFSIDQGNGFKNSSSYKFGSSTHSGNVSSNITFVTADYEVNVSWQFIVNDSNGSWFAGPVKSFVMPNKPTPPSGGGTPSRGGGGRPRDAVGEDSALAAMSAPSTMVRAVFSTTPGVDSVLNVNDADGVDKVIVATRTATSSAAITFNRINELPSSIRTPEQKVYKYFTLAKENIEDKNLAYIKVEFKVPRSYLNSNNIQPEQVKLARLTTQWNILPTEIVNYDSEKVVYRATSPGTSYFAIVSEQVSAEISETGGEELSEIRRAPTSKAVWIIIIVLIIIAAIIAYLAYNKKKK